MDIGNKLKQLRILKGLTQEELADRAELSKGYISQLERDLTSPSIATLMDILQCLGTSIGEFFNEEPEEQVVFGKSDYFEKVDAESGCSVTWIIPNAQKNRMEPILLTLEPGGSTSRTRPTRGKSSDTFYRAPSLPIHLGGRVHRAKKGESFCYACDRQHFLTSKAGATLIWVSAPPNF